MPLYQRGGKVWHYDFTVNGHRHRGSTGFTKRQDAEAEEQRVRRLAVLGAAAGSDLTVEAIASAWFTARVAGTASETTTARRLEIMLRLIGPHRTVDTIDSPDVARAIERRRLETTIQTRNGSTPRPPANATINRDLIDNTLRPILNYARRVLKLPVREIEWSQLRLQEPPARVRSFTDEERDAFLAALPWWHHELVGFYERYGARLGEGFFKLGAFDVGTGRVLLRKRKRGPDHYVRLLEEDRVRYAAFAERAKDAGLETLWFRVMRDGTLEPITYRGFQSACYAAWRKAGVKDARAVHDWRHHAATAILRGSGNLKVAGRLLGHGDLKSTARYAHAFDDDVLEAVRHTTDTAAERRAKKAS